MSGSYFSITKLVEMVGCGCFEFLKKPVSKSLHDDLLSGYSSGEEEEEGLERGPSIARSEDILERRFQNGLICRDVPVRETHCVFVHEDENGKKMLNEYARIEWIAAGNYGKVILYRSTKDLELYAIKVLNKPKLLRSRVGPSETGMTDVLREVSIMKMLSHPNIVNLIEVIDDPKCDNFYMVLEYVENKNKWVCDGSGAACSLSESTARSYLRDVVAGLMYLHSHNIIHGDIKPDNLLITGSGQVKIADFSVSQAFENDNDMLRRTPGTPVFTAPECCTGSVYYGRAADTWAVGVTLYCMVLGQYPFLGGTLHDTFDKIVHDPLSLPDHINPELTDLLERLLCKDPAERITLQDVAKHPWVIGDEGPIPNYVCTCKHIIRRNSSSSRNITKLFCLSGGSGSIPEFLDIVSCGMFGLSRKPVPVPEPANRYTAPGSLDDNLLNDSMYIMDGNDSMYIVDESFFNNGDESEFSHDVDWNCLEREIERPPVRQSEDTLQLRLQNELICRDVPVRETRSVLFDEDENGNKMVNEYVRQKRIGAGSYGKVVLYQSTKDSELYAIKVFHKSHLLKLRVAPNETAMSDVLREVSIMKMLGHPNIVNLIEVIDDPNVDNFYMVMEYVESKWICDGSGAACSLGESTARSYLRDIVAGLMYLHSHHIIHGDIKPDNLLVTGSGQVKIGDFGVSHVFEGDNDALRRSPGTPAFTAPECCTGVTYRGKCADIWAVGVTLYCMVLGQYPFLGDSLQDTYDKIVNDAVSVPDHINPEVTDLLERLLCKDPNKRITLQEVAEHDWVIGEEGPIPDFVCTCRRKYSSTLQDGSS